MLEIMSPLNIFCAQRSSFKLIAILIKLYIVLAADPSDITNLRKDLMTGYDKNIRPILNHKNTTTVIFRSVLRAFEFDEIRSIFTLHSWSVMRWDDEHLKWDPKNYGNLTYINLPTWDLWKPDLAVYNGVDRMQVYSFGYTRFIVYNTGIVFWVPPTRFQVGCEEDLRQWPYDVQTCHIYIGSWSHDGNDLDLALPINVTKIKGVEVVENREWKLVSTKMKLITMLSDGIPYPEIKISITIRRRFGTHNCAVVVPALAIATAVLISFWLMPGSAERLALILLIIIINAINLNSIYIKVVTHGDRVPLVLLFYRDSLIMVSIALVWTICLRYLAVTKRTSPVPLPGFVEGFLTSIFGKILCLDPRPSPGSASSETDEDGKLVSSGNPHQADWAWLAHLLDRVAFVLYLIVYICFYIAML